VAPNNRSAAQPVIDNFVYVPVDGDANGVPDTNPVPTAIGPVGLAEAPRASRLLAPRPNPFNPTTTLTYEVAAPANTRQPVELTVHDVQGRVVATLVRAELGAGRYQRAWDGRDAAGRTVASGVYVARLQVSGRQVAGTKLVLLE
jgi:hypothetical protein